MNSQTDKNRICTEIHDACGEWLSALSLLLYFVSTTVFDVRIIMSQRLSLIAIFLPALIFCQGYVVWYYFNKFRPMRKVFAMYDTRIVGVYSWLFVIAMVGTSLMALIGFFIL
jgi:hypothetical protein